jgi:hypothetical protein
MLLLLLLLLLTTWPAVCDATAGAVAAATGMLL